MTTEHARREYEKEEGANGSPAVGGEGEVKVWVGMEVTDGLAVCVLCVCVSESR